MIIGRYRDMLRHHLEIRGVGVIDVQAIFGIRAIRMQKRIEVAVELADLEVFLILEKVELNLILNLQLKLLLKMLLE